MTLTPIILIYDLWMAFFVFRSDVWFQPEGWILYLVQLLFKFGWSAQNVYQNYSSREQITNLYFPNWNPLSYYRAVFQFGRTKVIAGLQRLHRGYKRVEQVVIKVYRVVEKSVTWVLKKIAKGIEKVLSVIRKVLSFVYSIIAKVFDVLSQIIVKIVTYVKSFLLVLWKFISDIFYLFVQCDEEGFLCSG